MLERLPAGELPNTFLCVLRVLHNGVVAVPRSIDLVILYRILVCVKDRGYMNVTQLVKCVGGSASTITRYIDLAVNRGLLE